MSNSVRTASAKKELHDRSSATTFVCRAHAVVLQWTASNGNVLWYGNVQPKGRSTEKSRSSLMQGKHTVVFCLWAKQHNNIHTAPDSLAVDTFQQQHIVVWEGAAKGQEDREVKIIPNARQAYCSVVWAKQHNSIHTTLDSLAVDTLRQQRIVCGMGRCNQKVG